MHSGKKKGCFPATAGERRGTLVERSWEGKREAGDRKGEEGGMYGRGGTPSVWDVMLERILNQGR